jgi:hypothetical protein
MIEMKMLEILSPTKRAYLHIRWSDERSDVRQFWNCENLIFRSIQNNTVRPILAVLPLRGRIRANFGLVRVSGKNPKQRPSHSPDTNPEYPRAALDLPRKKNNSPTQSLFNIFNS